MAKNNVLLINPYGMNLGINTGLAYMAAVLKQNKIDVKIIDFLNQPWKEDERLKISKKYRVIGISIKTLVLEEALRIIKNVKKINPTAKIVCGGIHIEIDGLNFMKENPLVDVAVIGEGELTILEIAKGNNLDSIKGIMYRKGNEVITNSLREPINDLDSLPLIDIDSFDIPIKKIKNYPLVTSRGCPYNCSYCLVKTVGKKWRARSVDSVINELKARKNLIKEFEIIDDNFTLDVERAKEFCRALIKEKLNLKWSCPNGIRADRLDKELAFLMKKSGCYLCNIGIESADKDVFEMINKGESLDDIKEGINILKKAGISVFGNFIIGLPGSTYKKDMFSLKKSKEFGCDICFWYVLSVYPKTEAYNFYMKDKNFSFIDDWKNGFKYNFTLRPTVTFETKEYKKEELIKMFFIANLKSKAYGILTDPKQPIFQRWMFLMKVILKYDVINLPVHLFYMLSAFIRYYSGGKAQIR